MLKYKRILLVDDDADDRQIFEELLHDLDPDSVVESAENGLEMISLLDSIDDDDLPERRDRSDQLFQGP